MARCPGGGPPGNKGAPPRKCFSTFLRKRTTPQGGAPDLFLVPKLLFGNDSGETPFRALTLSGPKRRFADRRSQTGVWEPEGPEERLPLTPTPLPPGARGAGMSVHEAVDLGPEAAQHARLGDAHRHRRQAQGGGRLRRRPALEHDQAEGSPGGGLELRLEQLQQPADDVFVVLMVPGAAQL